MSNSPNVVEAPVTVVLPSEPSPLDTKDNKASKTTAEEDLKSAGQRSINNVWEYTQATIALSVVLTTCIGIFIGRILGAFHGDESVPGTIPFPPEWWTILGLVIGFYFGRTNHSRIGDPVTK